MATLQDYLGITALRDAWPKWKANVIAVNNQVIAHVAGSADKHAAESITYSGGFAGKTEVKAALDQAKTEIDTIVVNASIDPEVAFARDSTVKGETFDTLDARLEESEQDFVTYKAEIATYKLNNVFQGNKFAGHRGSGYAPENTMNAFKQAKYMGFNVVETDIVFTLDNEPIVFHDGSVDRMTDGTGNVIDLTLSQIQALNIDAGTNLSNFPIQKIPTLEGLLSWLSENNMFLVLELKTEVTSTQAQKVYDLLSKYKMTDKTIVISLTINALIAMRDIDDYIALAHVTNDDIDQTIIDFTKTWLKSNCGISPYSPSLTKTGVELAHDNDMFVITWGVDTILDAQQKIREYNVDYITSNYISEVMYNETI